MWSTNGGSGRSSGENGRKLLQMMEPMSGGSDGTSSSCSNYYTDFTCEASADDCAWDPMSYYCFPNPDNAAAAATECYQGCWSYMQGNQQCDDVCNHYLCDYDGGDCKAGATGHLYTGITDGLRKGLCADKCYAVLRNNSQCDKACANEACGFDDDDCCRPSYTNNLKTAGFGGFTLKNYKGVKGSNGWTDKVPTILPDLSSKALDRSILGANPNPNPNCTLQVYPRS